MVNDGFKTGNDKTCHSSPLSLRLSGDDLAEWKFRDGTGHWGNERESKKMAKLRGNGRGGMVWEVFQRSMAKRVVRKSWDFKEEMAQSTFFSAMASALGQWPQWWRRSRQWWRQWRRYGQCEKQWSEKQVEQSSDIRCVLARTGTHYTCSFKLLLP